VVLYVIFCTTMVFVEKVEGIASDWRKQSILVFGCHQWVAQWGQYGRGFADSWGSGHCGLKLAESCSTCIMHRIQYQGSFGFCPQKSTN